MFSFDGDMNALNVNELKKHSHVVFLFVMLELSSSSLDSSFQTYGTAGWKPGG